MGVANEDRPFSEAIQIDATWVDADGIKTSFAASAAVQTFTTFNGALTSAGAFSTYPAKKITVTRSSSTNDYTTTAITIEGTDEEGETITEDLTPANDDGGDVLETTQGFATVTRVVIPAQVNTDGAFTIGTGDLCLTEPARAFEAGADGAFQLISQGGRAMSVDMLEGAFRRIAVKTVSKAQAIFPFILYR